VCVCVCVRACTHGQGYDLNYSKTKVIPSNTTVDHPVKINMLAECHIRIFCLCTADFVSCILHS
jgi:hypothetical protein